jgi:hypothetical protein
MRLTARISSVGLHLQFTLAHQIDFGSYFISIHRNAGEAMSAHFVMLIIWGSISAM